MNANANPLCIDRAYEGKHLQATIDDPFPGVPVLPETLLALDLYRHEFTVDLRYISQIVLSDAGATLQILRLAGREYGEFAMRHLRIEDCICDLGIDACLRAVEDGAGLQPQRWRSVVSTWEHARTVAHCSRIIAENTPTGMNPDHAYLGGLLHILGTLPQLFDWTRQDGKSHPALTGMNLAEVWQLPGYIKDQFCECLAPGSDGQWSRVLEDAHRISGGSSRCCWFGHSLSLVPAAEA